MRTSFSTHVITPRSTRDRMFSPRRCHILKLGRRQALRALW